MPERYRDSFLATAQALNTASLPTARDLSAGCLVAANACRARQAAGIYHRNIPPTNGFAADHQQFHIGFVSVPSGQVQLSHARKAEESGNVEILSQLVPASARVSRMRRADILGWSLASRCSKHSRGA